MRKFSILLIPLLFLGLFSSAQESAFGNLGLDEFLRRKELIRPKESSTSWGLRSFSGSPVSLFYPEDTLKPSVPVFEYAFLPLYSQVRVDGRRPYVGGEYGQIPGRGLQIYLSTGIKARYSFLHVQIQPEFILGQNLPFRGFPDTFSSSVTKARFLYWNIGDSPERFGTSAYTRAYLGQSSIGLRLGAFELGAGTKNFWWGPGQWNSLIFSNNAPGFPYLSLNTYKPAKTFLGVFEGQLLIGRLESSGFEPTQSEKMNKENFSPLNPDWRYLNALLLSYSPKWIPQLSVGYMRTYQYFNAQRPRDFYGWLPVFEPMSKEGLFTNGNSVEYDVRAQSQQIAIFGRYKWERAKSEFYFQFGRRDHAFNWREFFLNPEHARAYQLGFLKLLDLPVTDKFLQVRGEITHQQESVNRFLRHGLAGGWTWHTHGLVRGFTHYGQPMGVGIGTGANVQTLEISMVENWDKWGILLERLEQNQDFYYRAFGLQKVYKPWIDYSLGFLYHRRIENLMLSSKLQLIHAKNYQWQLDPKSTPEFPRGQKLNSVFGQVSAVYFWNKSNKKLDVKD